MGFLGALFKVAGMTTILIVIIVVVCAVISGKRQDEMHHKILDDLEKIEDQTKEE